MKPHITYIISLPHALTIIKKMGIKKHRDAGYTFELNEFEGQQFILRDQTALHYAEYGWKTILYELKIFYKKPVDGSGSIAGDEVP